MAEKGASYLPVAERPRVQPRRWRNSLYAAGCAAVALLIYAGPSPITPAPANRSVHADFYTGLQACYDTERQPARDTIPSSSRANPRWNPTSGQTTPILIQNATLFDGEIYISEPRDILFSSGVIKSITPTGSLDHSSLPPSTLALDINGKHVTPGLVDMHSHHLLLPFPQLSANNDVNERPLLGPTTPFVRAIDGFTPSDPSIKYIASGGVTSSLILPGSANIIGGEAYPVKNLPFPGPKAEPVIEELLLEHGIPEENRQRYLKMACGENPKGVYQHTRLGLAYLLRSELQEAANLQARQESWCRAAYEVEGSRHIESFIARVGQRPETPLKYETLVALLRGELNVNVHCYTPEDFERMLAVLHEFGVRPRAFHHALSAWQVPKLLKELEPNITIATFADNALFKAEAYGANLRGPKILDEHGIPVALKSDHTGEGNNAKYLLDQASIAYSYGLPAEKALQSVTSIPARSLQQGHRTGYVRPGYDADLVIWDSHPLQAGATPVEVFIDGRSLLKTEEDLKSDIQSVHSNTDAISRQETPHMRPLITPVEAEQVCSAIRDPSTDILFTGIKNIFLESISPEIYNESTSSSPLSLLLQNNSISCLGPKFTCLTHHQNQQIHRESNTTLAEIPLQNGHLTSGLLAIAPNLGISAIASEPSTGDGISPSSAGADESTIHFAKYAVHLHGRAFDRARLGGVTRAVVPPHAKGFVQGVSVGIRTGRGESILEGGVWKGDVAVHFSIGQGGKGESTPTVGSGIEALNRILQQGRKQLQLQLQNKASPTGESYRGGDGDGYGVYARAANGSLPVIVHAVNEDDIAHLITLKTSHPTTNLIVLGGHSAALLAPSLAKAQIPVILSPPHPVPASWETQSAPPGPPLSVHPAKTLIDAGVRVGIAVRGDSRLHGLAREAGVVGRAAGLSARESWGLV
ncbi:hypothetical protein BJY04DRAFT_224767, partial [Aspergillus karnatakaensis]|uniref:uncharacterized protein n=1 Tax=Aspergillus karnatakaensis TaxID=1810916 RepID=UPI003CCCE21C